MSKRDLIFWDLIQILSHPNPNPVNHVHPVYPSSTKKIQTTEKCRVIFWLTNNNIPEVVRNCHDYELSTQLSLFELTKK
ncbi:MAG: hypothetical protein ABUK01_09830 [Leptospirales bacterium]